MSTAVLIARVRWVGAAVALLQAIMVLPAPWPRLAGIALALFIALYNLGPALAPRAGAALAELLITFAVVGDLIAATAWTWLTADQPGSLTYTLFALVALEAAFLFHRWGAAAVSAVYVGVLILLSVENRPAVVGIGEAGFVYRLLLVLMIAAAAAAIAEALTGERERLRQSEERTRAVLDSALTAVITTDGEGRITRWNPRAEQIFGWRADDVFGLRLDDVVLPPRHRSRGLTILRRTGASGAGTAIELTGLRSTGEEFPIELSVATPSAHDAEASLVAFIEDITYRRRAAALQSARYGVTLAINQAVSVEDGIPAVLQGVCTAMDWPLALMWRLDRNADHLDFECLWHADGLSGEDLADASRTLRLGRGAGLAGKAWAAEHALALREPLTDIGGPTAERDADFAAEGLHSGIGVPVRHADEVLGVIEFFTYDPNPIDEDLVLAMADIGVQVGQWLDREAIRGALRLEEEARRAAEARARQALEFRAFHDLLTGLPNRQLFADRLGQALALAKREQHRVAVITLDLDKFKAVNDQHGHLAGDLVLEEAAARLRRCLRSSDTAARLGGDEFAILPGGEADAEAVEQIAHKVIEAFTPPWKIDGKRLQLGVSLGIAFYPEHGAEAGELLDSADAAMYAAKRAGGGYAISGRRSGRRSGPEPAHSS